MTNEQDYFLRVPDVGKLRRLFLAMSFSLCQFIADDHKKHKAEMKEMHYIILKEPHSYKNKSTQESYVFRT